MLLGVQIPNVQAFGKEVNTKTKGNEMLKSISNKNGFSVSYNTETKTYYAKNEHGREFKYSYEDHWSLWIKTKKGKWVSMYPKNTRKHIETYISDATGITYRAFVSDTRSDAKDTTILSYLSFTRGNEYFVSKPDAEIEAANKEIETLQVRIDRLKVLATAK